MTSYALGYHNYYILPVCCLVFLLNNAKHTWSRIIPKITQCRQYLLDPRGLLPISCHRVAGYGRYRATQFQQQPLTWMPLGCISPPTQLLPKGFIQSKERSIWS